MREGEREKGMEGGRKKGKQEGKQNMFIVILLKKKEKVAHELNQD